MQALRKYPESVFRNGQSSPPLWSAITGLGVRVGSAPASTVRSAYLLRALQSRPAAFDQYRTSSGVLVHQSQPLGPESLQHSVPRLAGTDKGGAGKRAPDPFRNAGHPWKRSGAGPQARAGCEGRDRRPVASRDGLIRDVRLLCETETGRGHATCGGCRGCRRGRRGGCWRRCCRVLRAPSRGVRGAPARKCFT